MIALFNRAVKVFTQKIFIMAKSKQTPTMADVAARAGVSTATVSLVLNGRLDRTSEEVRQRVLQAVAELGYVPNQTARSLRRQRTEQVCLIVPRLGLAFYDELADELQTAADARDTSMVMSVGGSLEREQRILDRLRRGMADGVIIGPRYLEGDELALLAKSGVALVVISNYITQADSFDRVSITDERACYDATTYLIQAGHRQIAYLGYLSHRSTHHDRLRGYSEALRDAGLKIDPTLQFLDADTRERAYRDTRQLLEQAPGMTALLAASDAIAISAIWAIRDAGLSVPGDVAVIGVGNSPEGLAMQLTTIGSVDKGYDDLIALLFRRIESPEPLPGEVHTLNWTLIRRGTA